MKWVEIRWQSKLYQHEIALRDELLRAPLGLTFTPEDLQAEQNQLHFGVTLEDRLMGCLVVVPLGSGQAKIRQMCVDDACQRQGLGSFLMIGTESELIARRYKSIELNARDLATRFYEKLGYQKEGEEFIEVGIPHARMVKQLPASR